MAKLRVWLDDTLIKTPHHIEIEHYTLTEADRNAKGSMVADYIANKTKFVLNYNAITTADLKKIQSVLWDNLPQTRKFFHKLTIVEDNVTKSYTVYSGAINKNLLRTGGNWVWKDQQINLIEQ